LVAKYPCIVPTPSGPRNSHPTNEFGKNPFTFKVASNSPKELHTGETSPTGTPKAEERDDKYTKESKYNGDIKKRALFLILFVSVCNLYSYGKNSI
jgi:hypothetical protein